MGMLSVYLELDPAASPLGWTEYLSASSWTALSVFWMNALHFSLRQHRRGRPLIPEAFRSTLSTVKVCIHHCHLLPCSLTNSVVSSRLLFILWVCLLIGAYAGSWKAKPLAYLYFANYHHTYGNGGFWKLVYFYLDILLQCSKSPEYLELGL